MPRCSPNSRRSLIVEPASDRMRPTESEDPKIQIQTTRSADVQNWVATEAELRDLADQILRVEFQEGDRFGRDLFAGLCIYLVEQSV
jgi:hypothetical protein